MNDPCPHCGVDVNDLTDEIEWLRKAHLAALELKAGDTLAVFIDGAISEEIGSRLKQAFEAYFPGIQVMILGDGIRLGVLRASDKGTEP